MKCISKEVIRKIHFEKRLSLTEQQLISKERDIQRIFDELAPLIIKNFVQKDSQCTLKECNRTYLGGYMPIMKEVNVLKLLRGYLQDQQFQLALPQVTSKTEGSMCFRPFHGLESLKIGAYSILEPKSDLENVYPSLSLVPFAACDSRLHRVGFGKGYYDRFIMNMRKKFADQDNLFMGVGFEEQISVQQVPNNQFDEALDLVITDKHIYLHEQENNKIKKLIKIIQGNEFLAEKVKFHN